MKDIYLKFGSPAIKGESADKDHQGWIEVDSWNHSITQPRSATASTAGGHTSERCEHGDMEFTKDIDVVSPLLYQHASGGTTFDEVSIEFMRSDGEGNRVKYLEVKLKYVIISSIAPSVGTTTSTTDGTATKSLPSESFSLKYAAVQWKYTQQKVGGGQGGNAQGAWSLTKNDKTYAV
ncbi:type VI secretion system tube protein Hcp [Trinickia terrae]|uniref:Type VI secretion system tube protein Hcp n=1 Tax=Trinickia terrae TaxID=2571161 RepID=A0A4U1I4Y0_9BURK|nr:type VI secretion system tube protein Hcp [Trinickia terrae]TKC88332.1 type VI secretion system tube protein Hcp [Trinickia terrae]